jgi:hypothetical protein
VIVLAASIERRVERTMAAMAGRYGLLGRRDLAACTVFIRMKLVYRAGSRTFDVGEIK